MALQEQVKLFLRAQLPATLQERYDLWHAQPRVQALSETAQTRLLRLLERSARMLKLLPPHGAEPVATPEPGVLTVIVTAASRPMSVGGGSEQATASAGFVARERTDASARKLTLATLPISPSVCGMSSITTRAWPPGGSWPNDQTRSLASAPPAEVAGLAGGVVVISDVPKGTASRSTTSLAVALPTLRTSTS
jgi:hypothetical protein